MSDNPPDPDSAEYRALAERWFGRGATIGKAQHRALCRALTRRPLSHDTNEAFAERLSFGDRIADRVASFGGSWTFILICIGVLVVWVGVNVLLLTRPFDPYPFVFLNLVLSMVAALQAPIIMMSQNRQSAKDRLVAAHDYEVNLKAEIEIMALHEKLDRMRIEGLHAQLEAQQAILAELKQELARLHAPR
ncbi:hypothetical protein BKE38_18370 [Pseudoroseomonas deserti]|uniref:Cyclic nucleotide-binding protein n=1 Tax=Teichococcus deserti TaxID=1817963 RepID=A0A1V2H1A9_9PROT|nr:DUF1003 domain-containing protein [Pseudoroseomonas deserti]ONG50388.1 hypothetical protein BKE38_18370 [Pseudoroseomonas deserti]